ncbi:hypothetical protein B0H14DRAFT_3881982 [Mycena olivaceomarginata]|nr:hypothetical protein B0H14DRAFT_3881982 [Mycena olivaceomarginata]
MLYRWLFYAADFPPSSRSHRRKPHSSSSCPLEHVRTAFCLLVWGCYLALALFGVYMLKTYQLPGDNRFKPAVELALREPRPKGYGKDGGESLHGNHVLQRRQGAPVLDQGNDEENDYISVIESNWGTTPQTCSPPGTRASHLSPRSRCAKEGGGLRRKSRVWDDGAAAGEYGYAAE